VFASWFRGFFTGWLPPEDVHKVVDAYLYEGPKVLVRFGLALLKLAKHRLMAATSAPDFDRVLRRWVAQAVVRGWAASGNAAALDSISPALASELRAADAPAAGAPVTEPYTFALLSHTAFHGIASLSRSTIQKLMDRYLAGGGDAGAAHAAAGGGAASGGPGAEPLTSRGDGAGGTTSTVTLANLNSIVTVGSATGGQLSAGGVQALRRLALASSHTTDFLRTGMVTYDDLGDVAGDDAGAPPTWYNPKLVGMGSRLMTADFSPIDAAALRTRMTEAHNATGARLLKPPRYGREGGGAGGSVSDADSDAGDGGSHLSIGRAAAGQSWFAGLLDAVGRLLGGSGAAADAPAAGAGTATPDSTPLATETAVAADHTLKRGGSHRPTASEVFAAHADGKDAGGAASPPPAAGTAAGAGAKKGGIVPVALSVSSSPHLASLSTLLPERVCTHNWACVYTSDAHGSSLHALYTRSAGLGPVMLLVQIGVRGGSGGAGGVAAAPATSAAAGVAPPTPATASSATASKLATAVSSKRPVIGLYVSHGLQAPVGTGGASHAAARAGSGE
jgi:hypothetical protein